MAPGDATVEEQQALLQADGVEHTLGLALSTHSSPLHVLAEYISKATGASIALLAVQPKHTALEDGLSQELEAATQALAEVLQRVLAAALRS